MNTARLLRYQHRLSVPGGLLAGTCEETVLDCNSYTIKRKKTPKLKTISCLIPLILTLLANQNISSQSLINKRIRPVTADIIHMELQHADMIHLESWSKNEILIEAHVRINGGSDDACFNLSVQEDETTIAIVSHYGDLFAREKNKNCVNDNSCISYEVYVPNNKTVTIKSASGDVSSQKFTGLLETDLFNGNVTLGECLGTAYISSANGNIEVQRYKGRMDISTLSGNIKVFVHDAVVQATTISGKIHTKTIAGKQLNEIAETTFSDTINNGTIPLNIKTVKGNIYIHSLP